MAVAAFYISSLLKFQLLCLIASDFCMFMYAYDSACNIASSKIYSEDSFSCISYWNILPECDMFKFAVCCIVPVGRRSNLSDINMNKEYMYIYICLYFVLPVV